MQGTLPIRSVVDGRYRIQGVLAIDPASETYLTTFEPAPMLRYVVKVVRPDLDDVQEAARQLKAEADSLSRVRSDQVARMRGFGRADAERFYLVREFHEGPYLTVAAAAIRESGRTHLERLLQGISSAIRDIHAEDLCVGTLSPEHIVVVDDESGFSSRSVKLLSAGCRRGGSPFELVYLPAHARPFTAPEVLASRKSSEAGDIYSVAAVMWFVATGGVYSQEAAAKATGELAQAVAHVVRKACSDSPENRHVSIRDLAIAFRDRFALLDAERPSPRFQTSQPMRAVAHREDELEAEISKVRVFANRIGFEPSSARSAAVDVDLPVGVDAPLEPSAVNTGDYPVSVSEVRGPEEHTTPEKQGSTERGGPEGEAERPVLSRTSRKEPDTQSRAAIGQNDDHNQPARDETTVNEIAEPASEMTESNRLSGARVVVIFFVFSALFAAAVMLMAKWMQMN